ncbi:hypothetical protein BDR04DRAFT_1117523 [Suillus decipiens]|nr:hypothetical protein BDR04DRAFT_1117523 [Suillus decipiens]
MFEKLLVNTTTLLYQAVFLGLQPPDLNHHVIHDLLSEMAPGYSFLTNQCNIFHLHCHFLISGILDASKTRTQFSYQNHYNTSGIVWNISGVQECLKVVKTCLGNPFALMHYSSGQPGRGTELSILCWINTTLHPRNVYWFGGHLNIVTLYNKTQPNTGSEKLISCSLEPHVDHYKLMDELFNEQRSQELSSHSTNPTHSITPCWIPTVVSSIASKIAARVVPTLAVMLAPHIHTNIAKDFAAMEASMEVVYAGAVFIHPTRYAKLHAIMGS